MYDMLLDFEFNLYEKNMYISYELNVHNAETQLRPSQ
jgi:hypothetical protein